MVYTKGTSRNSNLTQPALRKATAFASRISSISAHFSSAYATISAEVEVAPRQPSVDGNLGPILDVLQAFQ